MRRVLLCLAVATCVGAAAPPANAITFGHVDGDRHPSVGSLLERTKRGRYFQQCSGSLVAPSVFLTAAHCVQGEDPERFWVTFDPVLGRHMTVTHGVAHYDRRAYTEGEANPHDIAVIVLDRAVDLPLVHVAPLGLLDRLKAAHRLHGALVTAVGYGAVRETMQGGYQSLLANRKRRYALQHIRNVEKQWLVLSMNPRTGDEGTCYGDSGGPHFLSGLRSDLEVSLTVTGDGPCKSTDKTFRLDTRVAHRFLGRFIDI
jgi:secreted trypsin-like serine protease